MNFKYLKTAVWILDVRGSDKWESTGNGTK